MLEIEEAIERLLNSCAEPVETELVPIALALGRVTACDIYAEQDNPPFDRSPLDGYAVRGEDTTEAAEAKPVELTVVGKIFAGQVFEQSLERGKAVRIMTGAPIPKGANAVIRQEDTDYGESTVRIRKGVKPWQNYCYAGEDYKQGECLLPKNTRINAGIASVIASLGLDQVSVYIRPEICVLSTGDEVMAPGKMLLPGKIYDSNLVYMTSRLQELSVPAACASHTMDSSEELAEAIRLCADNAKLIITSGSVSVGQKDVMHEVVQLLGAKQLFWKVRMKPGTPALAFVFQETLVVCLSGNPFGAVAGFELLVRPVLDKLTGQQAVPLRKERAKLQNECVKPAGARRFLRGFVKNQDGENLVWINARNQSSGSLSAMLEAKCLVEIGPEQKGARQGEWVNIYRI